MMIVPENGIAGMYEIKSLDQTPEKALPAKMCTDINLWHRRLIHTNVKLLKYLPNPVDSFPKEPGKLQPYHP